MPVYEYQASDKGRSVKGEVEAASWHDAFSKVYRMGYFAIRVRETRRAKDDDVSGKRISQPEDAESGPSRHAPPSTFPDSHADTPVEVEEARRNPKRRFGKYVILDRLGEGGMGEVYRAWDESLGRWVAIKVIRSTGLAGEGPDEETLARFQREARGAAGLRHPNVVQVYEAGHQEGTWFMALECVEGRSLREWLDPSAPTTRESVTERLSLFRQACSGLAAAHAAGVVHRDLKPENMLVEDGLDGPTLKIADFGICKRIGSRTELTATGQPMGTWAYMSPEQAMGRLSELGPASDVFAMGIILYEMTTGRRPFREENPGLLVLAIDREAPPRPRSLNHAIPDGLEAVILKCLEKDPSDRYADAAALCRDIDSLRIIAPSVSIAPAEARWDREEDDPVPARSQEAPSSPSRMPVEMTPGEATSMLSWQRPSPASPARAIQSVGDRSPLETSARITLTADGEFIRVFSLMGERVVVGRSGDCEIQLGGTKVSRQHCEILWQEGRHIVRDLGSSNGTLVNGTQVDRPVYLEDETEIQVGDYVLTYSRARPSAATMPNDMAAAGAAPPPPAPPAVLDLPWVTAPDASSEEAAFVDESPPGELIEPHAARLLRCGACGGEFTADSACGGQAVLCPNCGRSVSLPRLSDSGG